MHTVLSYTVHTQRALILLAVKLQRFQVDVTANVFVRGSNRNGSPVILSEEARGGVVECAVRDGLSLLKWLSAHRALLAELPASIKTLPAEAVSARQQHGVLEDALTHGAGEVLPEREGVLCHFLILHAFNTAQAGLNRTKQKHEIS